MLFHQATCWSANAFQNKTKPVVLLSGKQVSKGSINRGRHSSLKPRV